MSRRRTLDDALSPEEAAFVDPREQPEPPIETTMASDSSMLPKAATPSDSFAVQGQTPEKGLVSLNTRIPPSIDAALLRISMERRIEGTTPATKQDIVTEALTQWLATARKVSNSRTSVE